MKKELLRSRLGIFGGVCTGIANYVGVEPLLVQILFILMTFSSIPIILIYLAMWALLKKEPI